jgi:MFS family permease
LYFFIVGVWTNVYMLTPEIFPVKVRSFASGLCGLFATIGGALSGLIGGILWDYGWSSNSVLAFYTVFFIISGLSSVALKSITKTNQ